MFCSNCGKQLSDDAKFCNYCGAVQNVNVQNAKGTTNKVPEQSGYEVKPRVEKPKVEKASSKNPILLILIVAVVILLFVFIGRIVGRETVKPGSGSGNVSEEMQAASEAFEKAWKSAEYGAVYLKDTYSTHAYLNYGTLGLYFETIEDFSLQTEAGRDYLVSKDEQLKISVHHTVDAVPFGEQDEQKCLDRFIRENDAPNAEIVEFHKYESDSAVIEAKGYGVEYIIREDPKKNIYHRYTTAYKDPKGSETIELKVSAFSEEALSRMEEEFIGTGADRVNEIPIDAVAGDWEAITEQEIGETVSVTWGDGNVPENTLNQGRAHIKVVGAEAVRKEDLDGDVSEAEATEKNVFRVYYEYTNLSDRLDYSSGSGITKLTQDGQEFDATTGVSDEYESDFLDGPGLHGMWSNNSYTYVYPGTTILTYEEFSYNPQGGEVKVSFDEDRLVVGFDPANLPGAPQEPWVIEQIADPQYTKVMPSEGELTGIDGDYKVKVTGYEIIPAAEEEDNPSGTTAILRVYFDYTNASMFGKQDPMMNADIIGLQDGIELWQGVPAEPLESDVYTFGWNPKEVKSKKTEQISLCYALRSDSPVEVVFEHLDENPVGVRFDLK